MNFRRSIPLTLCASSMLFCNIACAQDSAPLPLQNPSFEDSLNGWTVREKVPMSALNAEAAHSGKMGLRVSDEDPATGANTLSLPVPITGGQGYRLDFWARTATSNAGVVQFRFFGADRKSFENQEAKLAIKSTDNHWAKVSLSARAPQNAATLVVWIRSYAGAKATIDFDEFSLQKTDEAIATGADTGDLAPITEIAPAPVVTMPVTASPVVTAPAVPAPQTSKTTKGPRLSPPYIMIKVDDLRHVNGRVHARWKKFAEFCRERKIHAGMGIICDSLEGDNPAYISWIKEQQATGLFEIWNHGFDHKEWKEGDKSMYEFKGPSYEQQKEHYTRAQQLAREKLGAPLATFGAPYNTTDANTVRVLSEDPDTKVWLYGDSKNPAGKLVLDRVYPVNIENPLFLPSLDKFIEGYNKYPQREYFVIQGHAAKWDEPRFEQFTKIVDFLIEQKAIFVTPSEFAKLKAQTPK